MIKIIKQGTRQKATCDECGCLFSYEAEDVNVHMEYIGGSKRMVKCPQCGHEVSLLQTREVTE